MLRVRLLHHSRELLRVSSLRHSAEIPTVWNATPRRSMAMVKLCTWLQSCRESSRCDSLQRCAEKPIAATVLEASILQLGCIAATLVAAASRPDLQFPFRITSESSDTVCHKRQTSPTSSASPECANIPPNPDLSSVSSRAGSGASDWKPPGQEIVKGGRRHLTPLQTVLVKR